jgi:hypothetical protein
MEEHQKRAHTRSHFSVPDVPYGVFVSLNKIVYALSVM